jgi:predicted alpha/beta hydrolase family esterase
MKKQNAILIHGTCDKDEYYSNKYPTLSNSHWFPWLSKQLIISDIPTIAVEIPDAYMPNYTIWKKEFERYDIGPKTILVGHSCGGGFLVRWLSENDAKVGKVILVAPWLDPEKNKGIDNDFFDFKMQEGLVSKTGGVTLFVSNDDGNDVQVSVTEILNNIGGIKKVEFEEYGHFTLGDMGAEEFPELFNEIIS